MNGFERRKEKKKESIRRAAMELFARYGFSKVSVKDIAVKAGVSHATIYNHFNSKEELVNDVMHREMDKMMAGAHQIINSDEDFITKVEMIRSSKVGMAGRYNGEMLKTAINISPEVYQYLDNLWQEETNQLMQELVEQGKQQGYINKEISTQAIMFYFDLIRAGAFACAETIKNMDIDPKLTDDVNRLFLYGLIEKRG
jgi:AcrR family transcriptional regulator